MAGAGSIIAANHTFNAAPKDGTVIGNISGPIILEQLFGNPGGAVRSGQVSLPGGAGERNLCDGCYAKTGSRPNSMNSSDRRAKQVIFGGDSRLDGGACADTGAGHSWRPTSSSCSGYKGTADVRMAIDGGEVEGFVNYLDIFENNLLR